MHNTPHRIPARRAPYRPGFLSFIFTLALIHHVPGCAQSNPRSLIQRIVIAETTDLPRTNWPILIPIALPPEITPQQAAAWRLEQITDASRLPVQFQVIDTPQAPLDASGPPPERQIEICFTVDLTPRQQLVFELHDTAKSDPTIPPTTKHSLKVSGKDFDLTINTGPITWTTHALSGQLLNYRAGQGADQRLLRFNQGNTELPIHWNPDVWAPPLSWGHTCDWDVTKPDLTPTLRTSRGPIVTRTLRRGEMPNSNHVDAAVCYTFIAGQPFVYESSFMRFTADTTVRAVRNNELVFGRGLHTHGAWPNADGQIEQRQLYDTSDPKKFFHIIAPVPPDVPWIAMFHEDRRTGIAIVNLRAVHTPAPGADTTHDQDAKYYFYDYGDWGIEDRFEWNFTYMCRTIVTPDSLIKADTTYAERCAFLVFELGDTDADRFDQLTRWAQLLRNPPNVTVESP
ncbi:MAG: hypothetical protein CMJ49_11640 [Planctomycetaceae bacterium]|nr:hypothetical protein [Planctomycetaceae bacterium]